MIGPEGLRVGWPTRLDIRRRARDLTNIQAFAKAHATSEQGRSCYLALRSNDDLIRRLGDVTVAALPRGIDEFVEPTAQMPLALAPPTVSLRSRHLTALAAF